MTDAESDALPPARLLPLGDAAVLVRFADRLGDAANRAAVGFAQHLETEPLAGALETVSNLVSVLVRYDPAQTGYDSLAGELRLRLSGFVPPTALSGADHTLAVSYGGEAGPDLETAAELAAQSPRSLVDFHVSAPVRVLATGFSPGFVYLGLYDAPWAVPRRRDVRERVPAGSILFAAGQTAIAATTIRSGWHVIGRTDFRNFDPHRDPPVILRPGDTVRFEESR